MGILDDPRYKENPINLFIEDLVLDIMGHLSPEKGQKNQALNLKRVFKTRAAEWRDVVREVLHLSPTFDVAVLDLWHRNSDRARDDGFEYAPRSFAQDFVDHYFAKDSKVDVWTPETLRAARERIRRRAG